MKEVEVQVCSNEMESWNTLWKWEWFLRDHWETKWRYELREWKKNMQEILKKINPRKILDIGCGFGLKSVIISEMGYNVEGFDGSQTAIKNAPTFAKEHNQKIKFFRCLFEELPKKIKTKYDCIFSDQFDWIESKEIMKKLADGIYSALESGGTFIFTGKVKTKSDLQKEKKKDLQEMGKFDAHPAIIKNKIKIREIEVYEDAPDRLIGNRIFLIEEKNKTKMEVAQMFHLYKWTFNDLAGVLKNAGFKRIIKTKKGFGLAIK